jgi:diguanylate cyclase (GGDEF)-like protein
LGYETSQMIDHPFLQFVVQSDQEKARTLYEDRMLGRQVSTRYELILQHATGRELPVEINASLTEYSNRKADLIFVRDISEQLLNRRDMEDKNRELAEAVENANQLKEIAVKRAQELETLQEATQVVSSLFEQEETIQRILEQLERVVPYDSAAVQLIRGAHLEIVGCRGFENEDEVNGIQFALQDDNPGAIVYSTGSPLILADVQQDFAHFRKPPHQHIRGWMGVPLRLKNRLIGIISLDSSTVDHFHDEQARLAGVFANQVAIALENTRLFEEVQRLAITDPLTGLYNRRHFYSLTMHEFLRYKRYGTPFSILMMDADHFKSVNDTFGHLSGDKVLQTLADLFRENMRNVDILCRFGGEEFIATLPETKAQEANRLAERLRDQIQKTIISTDTGEVTITVSIGLAEFGYGCETLDRLLDCVDKALYTAKLEGRNRVSVYLQEASS